VRVDILDVINRQGENEDRVITRVRLRVRRGRVAAPLEPKVIGVDERWTLARRGESWVLVSVDGDPIADAVLSAPLIASPSADTVRLHEASLLALSDPDPSGVRPGELVHADAPPEAGLRDLALADDRSSLRPRSSVAA